MRWGEERVERLARRRREQLGPLSDQAYEELRLAVRSDPESFEADPRDRAFARLGMALDANEAARLEEEFLDDDAYEAARAKRLERLRAGCEAALEVDADCLDARTVLALLGSPDADNVLASLDELWADVGGRAPRYAAGASARAAGTAEKGLGGGHGHGGPAPDEAEGIGAVPAIEAAPDDAAADATGGAWDDVLARPRLRLLAARARTQLDTARYRLACESCDELVRLDGTDVLGARYTWVIALARLEDERGFDQLDAKFGRRGNAWSHLARALLMFKLDRESAARRALRGYASLCRGGAYALLRPTFVDLYLPDRPDFEPDSFDEAMLAVHECDPVVMDTPDFLDWATAQDDFAAQAKRFAEDNDLDW